MPVRKLSADEISLLQGQGCRCSDWNQVEAAICFNTDAMHNVSLSGKIVLGEFNDEITLIPGLNVPSGLNNCRIHNCIIEDNVYINSAGLIANYHIKEKAVIDNVKSLTTEGITSFGNGTRLDIVNEGGGRTLTIFDKLTSNLAYLLVFYRHSRSFIENLENIIASYISSKSSSVGTIETGAVIKNCGSVKNTFIGSYAVLDGVQSLNEGTISSTKEDPVFIGHNVCADRFIILSGTHIDEGALLNGCFLGQAVRAGKQFSAENSAFFANSELFHGEACSAFGGPYTVSHHKSSLLIAGLFSFYNAGSGTNQSNHMYKLGPVHQGILERGSKTGSFSYLLWPSRIGTFTTVLGKHYINFDTSLLPFSYINEEEGKSYITPAMNMLTAGTRRDSLKWPKRDRRKPADKYDLINFDVFSPYTIFKMEAAAAILSGLYSNTPKEKENINYQGILIKRLLLKTSARFYEMGIKIFIGSCITEKLNILNDHALWENALNALSADTSGGVEMWADIAGLLAPLSSVSLFVNKIEELAITDLEGILLNLKNMFESYPVNKWNWCASLIEKRYNIRIGEITPPILEDILSDWKTNLIRLNNMIIQDAEKEFDQVSRIGYGIDGGSSEKDCDFSTVRGSAETDSFITELKKENQETEKQYNRLIELISHAVY